MTEQQKEAIKNIVEKFKLFPAPTGFILGMKEVLENPSKYGLQPVNEWVSVKDRLPEKSGEVFVFNHKIGFVCQIMFDVNHNAFHDNVENWNDCVSHWAYGMNWPDLDDKAKEVKR